jgi:hypothetical protein
MYFVTICATIVQHCLPYTSSVKWWIFLTCVYCICCRSHRVESQLLVANATKILHLTIPIGLLILATHISYHKNRLVICILQEYDKC